MKARIEDSFSAYLPPWPLSPSKEQKAYFETTQRICEPMQTLERLGPVKERMGITRVSDITPLDCVGIPVYQAVRPANVHYQNNICAYNGKGLTKIQAKVSAMMEAAERFSAELTTQPVKVASSRQIKELGPHVSPEELLMPPQESWSPEVPLEWVPGLDMMSGEALWVPAAAVFYPYFPIASGRFLANFSDTNGLASGNTLGEAITHAMFELIERDSEVFTFARNAAKNVDLKSIKNSLILELISKFDSAGINLLLKEITSDMGVPTFFASTDDPGARDPALLCYGMGSHWCAEIAAMRAITEVAQSRCSIISGVRRDLDEFDERRGSSYDEEKKSLSYWFEPGHDLKAFDSIEAKTYSNFNQDLGALLERLSSRGFKRAIAVNLTHPEVKIPVVRAIVPGLESGLESRKRGDRSRA